jgi:hypothetical protein
MRLGLENPSGILAGTAIGILVLLYLYDRRRRTIPVGTLFLWQQIASPPRDRRRFRPDLLFGCQLALLLALIGAYLRPVLEGAAPPAAGTPLVVVLDVSASMQTQESDGSRFEDARRRAHARIAALAAGDEVMIIAAGTRPTVALRWTDDRTGLRAALEALEPRDTPGDLGPALELARGLAGQRAGARVVVFTDLPPEASGLAPDERVRLDYVQVGQNDDNLAIAGVTIASPPFHGSDDTTATIDIRNYGRMTREVGLDARVGGSLWARRALTIAPRATEHVLLARPPASGVLELRLATDDALAVDDHAAAWIGPGAPLDLLLVTDSRELAAAFGEIAAAIAGSRVEVTTRDRYLAEPPAGRRVALFDGVVPATVPLATNALYVAPPVGNEVCPSTGRREAAVVVDWDTEHPALSGLGALQALGVEGASQLGTPEWGAAIVLAASEHAAFPLLIAGERNGRRTACLGAELSGPLASSDRVPLLLLTLATLRWLAEPFGPSALVVETGRPLLAGAGPTAPISGDGIEIAGEPPVLIAERTGVFRVGPPGSERMVLANLFDDRESDIGRSGSGEWPATLRDASAPPSAGGRPLAGWLYVAALVLLALEWTMWRRTQLRRAPALGQRRPTPSGPSAAADTETVR